ncbi:hypothetical protein D3C81_2188540 [compost metagenome]
MGHQAFELVFGAVGGEIGDLRLERVHQIGGGIDDGGAEVVDLRGIALHRGRKAVGFGIEPHAQHGLVLRAGVAQHVEESHGVRF